MVIEEYFDKYAEKHGAKAMREEERRVYKLCPMDKLTYFDTNNIDFESFEGQESYGFWCYYMEHTTI